MKNRTGIMARLDVTQKINNGLWGFLGIELDFDIAEIGDQYKCYNVFSYANSVLNLLKIIVTY